MDAKKQKRWEELSRLIEYHRNLYYHADSPIISDAEYDQLFQELLALEEENPVLKESKSPSQIVEGEIDDGFHKLEHPVRVLSLANGFSERDLLAWRERNINIAEEVGHASYCVEPKLDGLTVVLHYRDSLFAQGATRGDGEIGEDVTKNLLTINDIPKRLLKTERSTRLFPSYLVVRGEVFILTADFEAMNTMRREKGEHVYVNPRNAAAGALRQLDSEETAKRPLHIFCYTILVWEGADAPKTQHETLGALAEMGFPVGQDYSMAADIPSVYKICQEWVSRRHSIPYEIDGLVVKIDDLTLASKLGVVGKDPRGAIAYKFPAIEKTTKLLEIQINVGRTGVLTPLAILEPVEIGGVTVSKATLHNFDYIHHNDIRIGDTVLLKRAGDVIPYIMGSVAALRTGAEKEYEVPISCPSCGDPVFHLEEEVAYTCENAACPAQRVRLLEHFSSRPAMNIEGLGIRIVEQLVHADLVKHSADLYALKETQLQTLEGFGSKKVGKLIQAIRQSKNRPFTAFLYGLGIQGVGETTADALSKKYQSMEFLMKASLDELRQVEGIGEVTAQSIFDWFQRKSNSRILEQFKEAGVWPQFAEVATSGNLSLNGLTIVVTGTLQHWKREEIKGLILQQGGKMSERVTSQTAYVIVGEKPGSKREDALRLGVRLLTEEEFNTLVKREQL